MPFIHWQRRPQILFLCPSFTTTGLNFGEKGGRLEGPTGFSLGQPTPVTKFSVKLKIT